MRLEPVAIFPLGEKNHFKSKCEHYLICWIKDPVESLTVDGKELKDVANTVFFFHPNQKWEVKHKKGKKAEGYLVFLSSKILDDPQISNLHINQVRYFANGEIAKINLAPGIEKRVQSILEMLDELVGSHLNHKEEAILSLLNTFFVYCDGQCNIKSVFAEKSAKKNIVYNFKKLVDKQVNTTHEVGDYASQLNVSQKYLNACVKEVLGVNAKMIITEQRIMRSRRELKFSSKTIKEICFELGFSSADYFSYFLKKHTGLTPTMIRQQ